MRTTLMTLVTALALSVGALTSGAMAQAPAANGRKPADSTMPFTADDSAMNAAIAEAKRTLPIFWKLFDTDPVVAETAKLKMLFKAANGGEEHLWIREIRREGGVITGVLDNQPAGLQGLSKGDAVTVDPKRISDWRYMRDERLYGGFTTRVMVPRLPPEQQALFRRVLSDKPLEDGRP